MTGSRRTDGNGPQKWRRFASAPPPPAAASTGNWADLPDALLVSVLSRLPCLRDLIAVAAVCRSWRVAARSPLSSASVHPPPLLLCPVVRFDGVRHDGGFGRSRWIDRNRCKGCELISPIGPSAPSRAMIAPCVLRQSFLGSAYGQLIVCDSHGIVIADIFTGVELRVPVFPNAIRDFSYATLTCPLTDPGCSLLLCFYQHIFRWRVEGSDWEECRLPGPYFFPIHHIVAFKDEIFGLSRVNRLYAIELSPCFSVKQLAVQEMLATYAYREFLVECGGELLLLQIVPDQITHEKIIHEKVALYRLSFSGQLEWVKVDGLGDWALFIDDVAKTTASCANPGRWGGRSNCIYYAGTGSHEWHEFLLDETAYFLDGTTVRWPSPIWVYPSTVY